ncbi:hypothetical protein PSPO01_09160 [Paraphaeosphaeria sporulosa]
MLGCCKLKMTGMVRPMLTTGSLGRGIISPMHADGSTTTDDLAKFSLRRFPDTLDGLMLELSLVATRVGRLTTSG